MGVCSAKKPEKLTTDPGATFNQPNLNATISASQVGRRTSTHDVKLIYNINPQLIGQGHFGSVRACTRKLAQENKYAIKTIIKDKVANQLHLLQREVDVLTQIDHPNIIKFYGSFENEKYFHILMEFCGGGELLDKVIKDNCIPENEVKTIMTKIMGAIYFLHENGICHRDLKPENFLYTSDGELKMVDFGLSRKFYANNENNKYDIVTSGGATNLKTLVGTPLYVAPEVLKGKYDQRCDLWSLGVFAYVLLSGQPPFYGSTTQEIFSKIQKGEFALNGPEWKNITNDAKDFIKKLIVVDIKNRMSLDQAINHPWIKSANKMESSTVKLNLNIKSVLTNLYSYQSFKKEAVRCLVNNVNKNDITQINNFIAASDPKCLGFFSIKQIIDLFSQNETEVNSAMQDVKDKGYDMNIKISYSYLIGAILESQQKIPDYALYSAFMTIDLTKKGFIDDKMLQEYMRIICFNYTDQQIEEMIKQYDFDKDGKIGWSDFGEIFGLKNQNASFETIQKKFA